jgi:hypothetical protein
MFGIKIKKAFDISFNNKPIPVIVIEERYLVKIIPMKIKIL